MDDFPEIDDAQFELNSLQKKISEQKAEIEKLRQVIKENDLEEEVEGAAELSDAEFICIKGLETLKKLFENGTFDKSEVQQVEILVKTLRSIRGQSTDSGKKSKPIKTDNVQELFKMVKDT